MVAPLLIELRADSRNGSADFAWTLLSVDLRQPINLSGKVFSANPAREARPLPPSRE